MPGNMLRVAILVVSTTAAKDPSTDQCQATLMDLFKSRPGQWEVVDKKIVPDGIKDIQKQVTIWTDHENDPPINLILTTGGTGFSAGDVTPEAISPLLEKKAPGLVHAMLASSLQVTPFAMMSRPVAGVRDRTVIVTLPGSPKGAKENLEALINTLPHACMQTSRMGARELHEAESNAASKSGKSIDKGQINTPRNQSGSHGQSHCHHHGGGYAQSHGQLVRHTKSIGVSAASNDPSLGPSRRYRESPYPMLSVEEALLVIGKQIPPPEVVQSLLDGKIAGSVLAQDILANENIPAFRASIVDGYAVVVPLDGNMKGVFPVTAISHASASEEDHELKEGQIARITTGAPLPKGATSVIMVEDTILKSTTADGKEEQEVEILADGVKPNENIREIGSDIAKGTIVLKKGEKISGIGGEIGLIAAVGATQVQTYHRPTVAVFSSGNEIVSTEDKTNLLLGQVRDTNRPTLLSAIQNFGFEAVDCGIAQDVTGSLENKLRECMRCASVVVTTGGASMGELDLMKPTIERVMGGTIHFGRVNMKPGKPTTFATVPFKDNNGNRKTKAIFSLPGNPASALVTFHLFVLPALQQMAGERLPGLPRVVVTLKHDIILDRSRPEYHRAVVSATREGTLDAYSTGGQRSSNVGSLRSANALLCMPSGPEPAKAGTKMEALLMGPLNGL
ncbi:hypothetical protein Cpir12675_001047 [Ceratocystis pirilliformis]|uniref:MoaB/Mog domain-containing protein n=1 Tax=Ceratocystis pirilliformis TaxID=259994 RepID=A0ABR3ZI23_9PEZI